jgi:hypothetical protein|tara:strand:+ start:279 stop:665 length:387 start_codon:yes stop_codon:yes gene_type:complete
MSNSPFSRRGKNSRRRMNAKISKLENQVQSIQTRQDGGPVGGASYGGTNVLGGEEAGAGNAIQAGIGLIGSANGLDQENEDIPELAQPSISTIGSPFGPGAAAAGSNMFGAQVPGSFDRDMGEEEEIY